MNIGAIHISSPFAQAGLAGYSDRAMRLVARRRGCAYAVTEAMLDVMLLNGGKGLRQTIDINEEDHPLAGQIIGSDAEPMAQAAKIVAGYGYDVIDLNFACPVKKIKSKSRGGHMLLDVERGVSIVRAVREALGPGAAVTISLRRGFDESERSVEGFYRIIEEAWEQGYAAVRVHARTVEQKYLGAATWGFLKGLKERYPERTILGSGDVLTAEDAVRMKRETGVDIVWIARGAIGNPWIFRQAAALMAGEAISPPTIGEQRDALREHFGIAMQIHGEQLAGRRMRKMGIKYSRFHPLNEQVKKEFIEVKSLRDWNRVLDSYYAGESEGVWPDAKAADEVNGEG